MPDRPHAQDQPRRVMFLYWGRRGLSKLAAEIARTAAADPGLAATISVSRQNDDFAAFADCGSALFPIDTFSHDSGALTYAWRIPLLRRQLARRIARDRTEVVIELMPHVWSPFMASAIHAAGARYATIVHDADTHPGDRRTGAVKRLLDRAARQADVVFTLSQFVATRLAASGRLPPDRLCNLFLPDLTYAPMRERRPPGSDAPFRLLFMGRILPYKGLALFLDAVDLLHADAIPVEVGVFGDGPLGACASRLAALQAEIANHWLTDAEIAATLPRYHAMILSHTEASQSGVAAVALGAGLPVVATPVGGLVEQITDGHTGMLAARADAPALAPAIRTLLLDPPLYAKVCRGIAETSAQRSVTRFVRLCVARALDRN